MTDSLKPYASLYANLNILSPFNSNSTQSVFLLKGEDADGLSMVGRFLAARLTGVDKDKALNDFADVIVYPKRYVERIEDPQKKVKRKTDSAVTSPISKEEIDELFDTKDLMPFELPRKVYIMENADTIDKKFQNKLLKTLEEPPKKACFILCATNNLLPTVESRCTVLSLKPFPLGVVLQNMTAAHPEQKKERLELCARSGRGYFGIAEKNLSDEAFLSDYSDALAIISAAQGSVAFGKTSAIYEKYDRKKVLRVLSIMQNLYLDIARRLVGSPTVYSKSDIDGIIDGFTVQSAGQSAAFALQGIGRVRANGLVAAVMDTVVLKSMEAKALCRKLSA